MIVISVVITFLWCRIASGIISSKYGNLQSKVTTQIQNTAKSKQISDVVSLQNYLIQTLQKAQKSVVSIAISKDVKFYVEDPSQMSGPWTVQTTTLGWWSGILVAKHGYIITNKHVVQDTASKYAVTLSDGKIYNVDKIWFDDVLDIAVLRIVDSKGNPFSDLPVASFLSINDDVQVGQFVWTIGNALAEYANSVSFGIISSKNKQLKINKSNLYIWLYQTDALVNLWNSWGPLLDINGNVIGISTALDTAQKIAFALPLTQEFVDSTIKSVETYDKIARPLIGIQYLEITPSIQKDKKLTVDQGIFVKDVLADLPAAQAGIKIWDIITSINGKIITDQLPFLYQLYTSIPGDTVALSVLRAGKPLTINVVLGWGKVN